MGRGRKPRPAGIAGEIGEAVECRRKALGWDVDALAAGAGVGRGTVIRIEAGATDAGIGTVLAIARALGVSGAELLAGCPEWGEVVHEPKQQAQAGAKPARRPRRPRRA